MTLMIVPCKLQRCLKKFKQSRDWQKFCCKEHQKEYWNELHKNRNDLAKRVGEIEEKLGIKK